MSRPWETDGDEMYYDAMMAAMNDRVVSDEAQCGECDGDLVAVGTFYACQDLACSRYAVPVNAYGNTDAEQEEIDAHRGEQQAVSDMENGYDVPGVFGYRGGSDL